LNRLEACIVKLKEAHVEIDDIVGRAMSVAGIYRAVPSDRIEREFRKSVGMAPLTTESLGDGSLRPAPPNRVALDFGNGHVEHSHGSSELGKSGLRRMLIALAQNPDGLSDSKLGLRADVSVKGGSFDSYLSKGRRSGWIDGERSKLKITALGLTALGPFDPLPTGRALLDFWLNKLGNSGTSRMLDVLSRMYPKRLTAAELGKHAGVSVDGGSFDSYLSKLRGFDLVTGDRATLKASEEFFR
jgi:hypothetical protein